MEKVKTHYSCQQCGYQSPKWLGRCPGCGEWNTLSEEAASTGERNLLPSDVSAGEGKPQRIVEIDTRQEGRVGTGIGEFDRVLGGGVVVGSVVLIGGDPGIGKSTLLLQALDRLACRGYPVLYVSGEESARQTKMRAERLGVSSDKLYLLTENCLEKIVRHARRMMPTALVIDSVQTTYTLELQSTPGSISQVRESSGKLVYLAKSLGISTFLIGHVTKEGAIAGPRVLEHMVDTVLYFEGDRGHPYRVLRAVKNRFGSSNEIGVFEMKNTGLAEVVSPSELFLAEKSSEVPGSVVVSCLEGTRPILIELQALVCPTSLGVPRRTTIGVDHQRVSLLVAVVEKQLGLKLFNQDIFLNVAGGVRIEEPGIDLGIVAAVASSYLDKPVDSTTVLFGEVGLTGEVRRASQGDMRVREAVKLGFGQCLLPEINRKRLEGSFDAKLIGIATVKDLVRALF